MKKELHRRVILYGKREKTQSARYFQKCDNAHDNFPSGVIVRVNTKGWMNTNVISEWINSVWRARSNAVFQPQGMLVLDSIRAHIIEEVKKPFAKVKLL